MKHINEKVRLYSQLGFTLIELIMVIVILGILSAFALPKFVNFSEQAERSVVEQVRNSVKSATAISHAQALAAGNTGATDIVSIEGAVIDLVHTYPTANADSQNGNICTATEIDMSDFTCVTTSGSGVANSPRVMTITLNDSSCSFTYTEVDMDKDPVVPAIGALTNCP